MATLLRWIGSTCFAFAFVAFMIGFASIGTVAFASNPVSQNNCSCSQADCPYKGINLATFTCYGSCPYDPIDCTNCECLPNDQLDCYCR